MKNPVIITTIISAISGIAIGLILKNYTSQPWLPRNIMLIKFPGEMFIRLINGIILPFIISSIVSATCNLNESGIGIMALYYYVTTTTLGIIISVVLVQLVKPGELFKDTNSTIEMSTRTFMTMDTFLDLFRNLIPDNLIKACLKQCQTILVKPQNITDVPIENWRIKHEDVEGTNVLGLVFFSLLLGLALGNLKERGKPAIIFFNSLSAVTMNIMNRAIMFAPLGVLFLMPARILEISDFNVMMKQLGVYIVTVFFGLILHGFIILPLLYFVITHKSPYQIITNLGPAFAVAFGTSSSTATVPVTIKCLKDIGIDPTVLKFIIPIGASINMDGIALYETIGAIFIIQMRGIQFSLFRIIIISITCTISCIGASGLPNGGYMMLIMVLNSVGVPVDDVALIIAIDCFVDRFRTTINIITDAMGSGIISYIANKNKFDNTL